jgi:hypothetical protein
MERIVGVFSACHNGDQPLALISLSVGGGSQRSRHIPCHIR